MVRRLALKSSGLVLATVSSDVASTSLRSTTALWFLAEPFLSFVPLALLSTPEGEDKPLKYPGLFRIADTVILSKMDLASVIGFDREACERNARSVNPQVEILALSARTGEGMEEWRQWLEKRLHA